MSQGLYDDLSEAEIAYLERQAEEREERDRQDRIVNIRADARDEGLAKGLAEGKAKAIHRITLNMLREGCDHSFISKVTGLSETEISRLKNRK